MYLLQGINIHQCRINGQTFMLDLPAFNKTSNYTYQQEILPTFMLVDGLCITHPLNRLRVEVITNL